MLNSAEELWKGLSDIPIFALAVLFGVLLMRQKGSDRGWMRLFFRTAAASAGGMILHVFRIAEPYLSLFWAVLYVLLFALTRHFVLCLLERENAGSAKGKRLLAIGEVGFLAAAVLLRWIAAGKDIYMLVAFCAVLTVYTAASLARRKKPLSATTVLLLVSLAAALVFQGLKAYVPYGVVIGHVLIMTALTFAYGEGRKQTFPYEQRISRERNRQIMMK